LQKTSVSFPNPSRCYDAIAQGVHFWGYDRTFEIAFFVGQGTLSHLESTMASDEASMLDTFDVHHDRICKAASDVYGRRRKSSRHHNYTLTDSDF
jgi:hypothetical protein